MAAQEQIFRRENDLGLFEQRDPIRFEIGQKHSKVTFFGCLETREMAMTAAKVDAASALLRFCFSSIPRNGGKNATWILEAITQSARSASSSSSPSFEARFFDLTFRGEDFKLFLSILGRTDCFSRSTSGPCYKSTTQQYNLNSLCSTTSRYLRQCGYNPITYCLSALLQHGTTVNNSGSDS